MGNWRNWRNCPTMSRMALSRLTASIGLVTFLAAAPVAAAPVEQAMRTDAPRWFRGNTHTHSLNSDGDSTPEDVARWYREHGKYVRARIIESSGKMAWTQPVFLNSPR